MAVRIADTLGTMGEGGYALVKAADVRMNDNRTVETVMTETEALAKSKGGGYVFDTVAALDAWLADSSHTEGLALGTNFYIRAVDVPDYWWDGTQKQQLETQKVDLTEYAKTADITAADYASKSYVDEEIEKIGPQYTLPAATAETLGGIRVGEGLEIDEDGILAVVGGGTTGQTIQLEEMPEASEAYANKIFEYVGETTDDYTNGYFYKCEGISQQPTESTVTGDPMSHTNTSKYNETIVVKNTGATDSANDVTYSSPSKSGTLSNPGNTVTITLAPTETLTLSYESGSAHATLTISGFTDIYGWVFANVVPEEVVASDTEPEDNNVEIWLDTSTNATGSLTTAEELNVYSTDETICGTWIDGKPVYRKAFELTLTGAYALNSWYNTNITISNVKSVILSRANISSCSNTNNYCGSGEIECCLNKDTGVARFKQSITSTSATFVISFIYEYTKTTD